MMENPRGFTSGRQVFLPTKTFWLLNLLAWFVFSVAHSLIETMSLGNFFGQMKSIAPTSLFACVYCFLVSRLATAWRWFEFHPLRYIPFIFVLAVIFAAVDTSVHYMSLIRAMPVSCAASTQPPDSYLCGVVINNFYERIYAILIWLMLFLYLQFERYNQRKVTIRNREIVAAIFVLLILKFSESTASAIAWVRHLDLFIIINCSVHLFFTILLSRVILLFRPRELLLGSQLIPLLPTILMLIFCLGVSEMIVGNISFRAIDYAFTSYHSDQPNIMLYILLGGSDGIWRSAGDLSGPLYTACRDIFIIAIFWMYLRIVKVKAQAGSLEIDPVDFNRSLFFWAYNLNGWFVVATCLYFSDIFGLAIVAPAMPAAFSLSYFISGVFMAGMIRSILRNHVFDDSAFIPFATRVILVSMILGVMQACVIWFCNYIYIYLALKPEDPFRYAYFVSYTYHFPYSCVVCALSFVLWSLAYEVFIFQRDKVHTKLKQLQLENNIKQLQLNALAGKIDPHFVFNAINNIRYLVRADAERAREALLILSNILRNPIAKTSSDKVLLLEELELVRNYMTLSKLQFEQRLQYDEDIDTQVARAFIPPMMLQIMVENAIKHGISQLPDGGILSLRIKRKDNFLICSVENTGELLAQSATAGFGVGTKNIRERIQLLYAQAAHFSLVQRGPNVIAELTLPLEYAL